MGIMLKKECNEAMLLLSVLILLSKTQRNRLLQNKNKNISIYDDFEEKKKLSSF